MQVVHEISSVYNSESTVLILGSMPSVASRKAGFFYMHPQNRFWQRFLVKRLFTKTTLRIRKLRLRKEKNFFCDTK